MIDSQVVSIWALERTNRKSSFDRYRAYRKGGRLTLGHFHDDAVVQSSAGTEATFHVIANQDELLNSFLLKTRQYVATDTNTLTIKIFDFLRQHRTLKLGSLLNGKLDAIKRQVFGLLGRLPETVRGGQQQ